MIKIQMRRYEKNKSKSIFALEKFSFMVLAFRILRERNRIFIAGSFMD